VKSAQQIFNQLKSRLQVYTDHPEQWETGLRVSADKDFSWRAWLTDMWSLSGAYELSLDDGTTPQVYEVLLERAHRLFSLFYLGWIVEIFSGR